jgi:hypothetical protein
MRRRTQNLARQLVRPGVRLSAAVRIPLFAVVLAVLGASYAATRSEGLQIVIVITFGLLVLPVIEGKVGVPSPYLEAVRDHDVPRKILGLSLAFLAPGMALLFIVEPDLGVGFWFWLLLLFWPWSELYIWLAERDLQRGGHDWRRSQAGRGAFLAVLATVVCITALALLENATLWEALLAGATCGVIVFAVGAATEFLSRCARP